MNKREKKVLVIWRKPINPCDFPGISPTPYCGTDPGKEKTPGSALHCLCPERPPGADGMLGAEFIAQKTHTAEIAFFRIHTVPFYFDKNSHRA
jgi:hypothetical protein